MKNHSFKGRNDRRTRSKQGHPIAVERLEDRCLMAAEVFLDNVSGILYVEGTDAAKDVAEIRLDTKGTASIADDKIIATLVSTVGNGTSKLTGIYNRASVKSVVFNGYAGNDQFDNQTSIPSEADGGVGADILLGGYGVDNIYGGDGDDYLDGRTGNDNLYGGLGVDLIFGDKGNDFLYGGSGNDYLFGGAGTDYIFGELGNDVLDGGADVEGKMIGSTGIDTFVDDTNSFPGGDFNSQDKWTLSHSSAALFDYNVANDTTRSADRLKAFLNQGAGTTPTPNPVPVPVPTPTPSPTALNAAVLAFAKSKLGTKVGDGGCTRLIEEALKAVGAKPGTNLSSPGFYVWGKLLTANESMLPGDIIQFAPGTKFATANSSLWMDSFFGHAAIIESVNGKTITILNQNMAGSPVIRTTIDLSTKVAGSFSVYHAVPK